MLKKSRIAVAIAAALTLVAPAFSGTAQAATTVTANTAGHKLVGQGTSTWGSASGAPNATAWTEVKVGGAWSRSQVTTTSSSGSYTIPLTYGASTIGTTTWRVGVAAPDGTKYSNEFKLTRYGVSATSAGTKQVGQASYTWGSAPGAGNRRVWTEVNVGGRWSTSQVGTTTSTGSYTLPMTYGASSVGTTTWRVGVSTPAGTAYSKTFTLTRTSPASTCRASYYYHGTRTANGEYYNPDGLTAAHRTFPFGTKLKVTNRANGRSVIVRINDRGPFVYDRCMDLSRGAMSEIGGIAAGIITVDYVKVG